MLVSQSQELAFLYRSIVRSFSLCVEKVAILLLEGAKFGLLKTARNRGSTGQVMLRRSVSSPLTSKNSARRLEGLLICCVEAVACPGQQQQVATGRVVKVLVSTSQFFREQFFREIGGIFESTPRSRTPLCVAQSRNELDANVALLFF